MARKPPRPVYLPLGGASQETPSRRPSRRPQRPKPSPPRQGEAGPLPSQAPPAPRSTQPTGFARTQLRARTWARETLQIQEPSPAHPCTPYAGCQYAQAHVQLPSSGYGRRAGYPPGLGPERSARAAGRPGAPRAWWGARRRRRGGPARRPSRRRRSWWCRGTCAAREPAGPPLAIPPAALCV